MSDNLRILRSNPVDLSTTTIAVSSTRAGSSAANLKKDYKSLVWQSNADTGTLTVDFNPTITVGGVILPYTNLSSSATIRVRGYNVGLVEQFDTGTVLAAPYSYTSTWALHTIAGTNASIYAYGGGSCARAWVPNSVQVPSISRVVIDLVDTGSSYLEVSRLLIGEYWSPRFNTSYGLSTGYVDTGKNIRMQSGDLISNRGPRHKTMSFDLKYMVQDDRNKLQQVITDNGTSRAMFISLFPEDPDVEKEKAHQIYGKLSQISAISHPYYLMYSSSLELEEV